MDSIVTVLKSILDVLKSNPAGAGSFLVAVTVLLVFQWWRQRKVFSYKVISDYSLFNVDEQFSDRVKILFDDKPVGRVSLIVIELRNSGWVPIEDKDFFKPVEINFGQESEIMHLEPDETHPKDMGISTLVSGSRLVIEPTLFNRRDFVRLKVLVHGYKEHITVSGRIKGVPKIKREASSQFIPLMMLLILAFNMTYFIFGQETGNKVGIIIVITSGFISIVMGFWLAYIRPRRIRIHED